MYLKLYPIDAVGDHPHALGGEFMMIECDRFHRGSVRRLPYCDLLAETPDIFVFTTGGGGLVGPVEVHCQEFVVVSGDKHKTVCCGSQAFVMSDSGQTVDRFYA